LGFVQGVKRGGSAVLPRCAILSNPFHPLKHGVMLLEREY